MDARRLKFKTGASSVLLSEVTAVTPDPTQMKSEVEQTQTVVTELLNENNKTGGRSMLS